jgi:hypothetical protein
MNVIYITHIYHTFIYVYIFIYIYIIHTAFEAVMRVRATRGIRITNFYGNYFIRGTDLLALPNCTADSTFALDMGYDEQMLSAQAITVQAALLYTSSLGERRIRVHTMVLPVTQSLPEMLDTVDIDCAVNILAKQAVDIAQKSGLDNARQRLHQSTVDILRASKNTAAAIMGGQGGMGMQSQYGGMPGTALLFHGWNVLVVYCWAILLYLYLLLFVC